MGRPVHKHTIRVVCDGQQVTGWQSYSVNVDMLQPADSFSLSMPFSRAAWEILATDAEIAIHVDSARVLTGYVGQREKSPGEGTFLRIQGRDKTGRLVDESSPLFRFGGLYLKELAERICGIGTVDAIFDKVTLRNVENRSLLRQVRQQKIRVNLDPLINGATSLFRPGLGQVGIKVPEAEGVALVLPEKVRSDVNVDPVIGPIADAARTAARAVGVNLPAYRGGAKLKGVGPYVNKAPIINPGIFEGRAAPKKVLPGQTRWGVLEEFLREARLLAWSTGDGRELFIGLPTYEQDISYAFFEASSTSKNRSRTNARIGIRENVEEMYSLYMACGASRGDGASYGANVTRRIGRARDNPETKDGTGVNFRRPKTLLISDDGIRSQRDATERSEREKLQREASFREAMIDTVGHGQQYDDERVIYAVDTMAQVTDEDTGTDEPMLITSMSMNSSGGGTYTSLRAVPKGTLLSL